MMRKPPEVPLKRRWLLYTGAWGAAFLSFFIPALLERSIPDREQILLLLIFSWVFPAGLAAWFNHARPFDDIGLAVLWLAYLVHGFFTLRSRTRVRFYSLLLILAIVLVFNVLGCHRIKTGPRAFG
jgi:peptidoglycan/LPS O-acetylase OafA/YrhL